MYNSKGKFRVGVDIGGTFIDRRWLWFTMASASDPGVQLAQSVLAANIDQDHVLACRMGDATARPESIHACDSGVRFRRARSSFPGLK